MQYYITPICGRLCIWPAIVSQLYVLYYHCRAFILVLLTVFMTFKPLCDPGGYGWGGGVVLSRVIAGEEG